MVVVVVHYSRSRVVRRMMIRRWQALRRVGVMLKEAAVSNAASVTMAKAGLGVCNDVLMIRTGDKRRMKLDDGWSAGLRDVIRLGIQGGDDLQQRTCESRVWKETRR